MAGRTTVRRVIYQVAASLDGFIAGPGGEADWIPMDPEIDFAALLARYDTVLMGRRTFDAMGGSGAAFGKRTLVASRSAPRRAVKGVEHVRDAAQCIRDLRATEGSDVWLFGGGALASELLDEGLVDLVEIAVIPILLGSGVPLLAPTARRHAMKLIHTRVFDATGTALLTYETVRPPRDASIAGDPLRDDHSER